MMERLRSVGAAVLLVGIIALVIGPWLGLWAMLSSTPEWFYPLVAGVLLSVSGGAMLFLAWAHDRGETVTTTKVDKTDDEDIDEFTKARVRSIYDEELWKLRDEILAADWLKGDDGDEGRPTDEG